MSTFKKGLVALVAVNVGVFAYLSLSRPHRTLTVEQSTLPPGLGKPLDAPFPGPQANGFPGPPQPPQPGRLPPHVPGAEVPAIGPDFELDTTDGKHIALSALARQGPVLLCFSKAECGTTNRVASKFNAFATWYAAKSPAFHFYGIWTNTPQQIEIAKARLGLQYSIAPDTETLTHTHAYGMARTPTLVLLGTDKKPIMVVNGWNRSQVNDLSRKIADLTKVPYVVISEPSDGLNSFELG